MAQESLDTSLYSAPPTSRCSLVTAQIVSASYPVIYTSALNFLLTGAVKLRAVVQFRFSYSDLYALNLPVRTSVNLYPIELP